jgi:site-specific recombinase XerD
MTELRVVEPQSTSERIKARGTCPGDRSDAAREEATLVLLAEPLDDSQIRKAIKAIAKRTKVRARKSVHILLHTFVSLLLSSGQPSPYVKAHLGHASVAITWTPT